ncbi:MAG: hypothetical protein QOE33_157 [Acidobacteriota bacterium]|nr:hypothetical protein [Acidobacteriota bacterium]
MRIADDGLRIRRIEPLIHWLIDSLKSMSRWINVSMSKSPQSAIRNRRACNPQSAILIVLLLASHTVVASNTWTVQSSGTLAWLRAVYFLDAEHGWAAGSRGALLSTGDGGRTWRTHQRPTEDSLRDLFFTDSTTGWLVCERDPFKLSRLDEPRAYLLKTIDGGATWSRVEVTSGDDAGVVLTRIVFADSQRGWTVGETGAIYATRDAGATWSRQRVPTQRLLLGAYFLDAAQGWLVGTGATILQTSDGGAQWRGVATPADERARLYGVSFCDARHGWAVGAGGTVLATSDGGRTWRRQASNTDADLSDVSFLDAQEGWAVGENGTTLHTSDGGATWDAVPSGTRHPLERLAFVSHARGWAVGFGGTIIAYTPSNVAPPRIKN